MGHYVYKYVYNNEIIYIGKNDTNLVNRINQHGKQGDNIPEYAWDEINSSDIYYAEVANYTMSEVIESALICKYKPKYNKAKITDWSGINFTEPIWYYYKKDKFIADNLKKEINNYKNSIKELQKIYDDLKNEYDILKNQYDNTLFNEKKLLSVWKQNGDNDSIQAYIRYLYINGYDKEFIHEKTNIDIHYITYILHQPTPRGEWCCKNKFNKQLCFSNPNDAFESRQYIYFQSWEMFDPPCICQTYEIIINIESSNYNWGRSKYYVIADSEEEAKAIFITKQKYLANNILTVKKYEGDISNFVHDIDIFWR